MKDPIPSLEKSGIYNIIVPDHGEYIGKTSRPISTRLKEHFASVRNKHPEKSGFANYMVENNVPLSKCSTKVLHSLETNPKKLDLLETLYIRKAANPGKILFKLSVRKKSGARADNLVCKDPSISVNTRMRGAFIYFQLYFFILSCSEI
jgi:GIY-YIG catalytic domain.